MPNIDVEVEVYCKSCGAGLCNQTDVGRTRGRGQQYLEVTPCETCLEKARKEGKSEGYSEGYEAKEKELVDNPAV